jgi:hypothetical protein
MKLVEFFWTAAQVSLCWALSELSFVSTFRWCIQKIASSGVLLYVVEMDFYGDIAFFGNFMVVWECLWSNTYPERGEAPIGFVPVLAGGETFRTLSNTFVSFNFLFSSHNNKHYCSISPCLTTLLRRQRLVDYHIITDNDEVVLTPLYKGNIYQAPSADATASLAMAAPPFFLVILVGKG